jgi:hypothetical protein
MDTSSGEATRPLSNSPSRQRPDLPLSDVCLSAANASPVNVRICRDPRAHADESALDGCPKARAWPDRGTALVAWRLTIPLQI